MGSSFDVDVVDGDHIVGVNFLGLLAIPIASLDDV
jgi:hypothetical protein